MKKDIETLIAEERADIITKYDKGKQEGTDAWEDADLKVYKVTDRFGFMHEEELPTPTAVEEKQKMLEVERAEKWLKMVKKWDKYRHSDKMVKRVYKGIPLQLRGQAWALMLDLEKMKQDNAGKYEKMKQQARNFSTEIKQIDLDVNRTFRNHAMFMDRFGVRQQALFHVLAAYSVYNTEVSYCQGMSQVAALLLMFLNEEEAFWALSQLLTNTKHAMHGFFIPGFPKLHRFQSHHDLVLSKMLPRLRKHMDKEQMLTGIYTTKWFLQCFIDRTPFMLTLRLWDIYMLEGEKLLTAFAYTALKIHRKRLLKLQLEDLREFIQENLGESFGLPDDTVVEHLQTAMSELRSKKLDFPPPAKSEELPMKALGLERPVLLLPLQPDPSTPELQHHPEKELPQNNTTTAATAAQDQNSPSPSPGKPQESHRPPGGSFPTVLPSPDRKPCRAPPAVPAKPVVGVQQQQQQQQQQAPLDVSAVVCAAKESRRRRRRGGEDSQAAGAAPSLTTAEQEQEQEEEPEVVNWPPPPSPFQARSLEVVPNKQQQQEAEEEEEEEEETPPELPDLPPPLSLRYEKHNGDPFPPPPPLGPLLSSARGQRRPTPPSTLHLVHKAEPAHSLPAPRAPLPLFSPVLSSSSSSSSSRLSPPPPQSSNNNPTKFPVSLCVPTSPGGGRRPSNTSQYDNLTDGEEEDRYMERLLSEAATTATAATAAAATLHHHHHQGATPLSSTPEEGGLSSSSPSSSSYGRPPPPPPWQPGPAARPLLSPPLAAVSPSSSPLLQEPSPRALHRLPQEPAAYDGRAESWVGVIPPPPPCFADHPAAAPAAGPPHQLSCHRPFDTTTPASSLSSLLSARGPRGHAAFPAPLLYTGHSRAPGRGAAGGAGVRSSPDFYRMHAEGQKLPNSVTF